MLEKWDNIEFDANETNMIGENSAGRERGREKSDEKSGKEVRLRENLFEVTDFDSEKRKNERKKKKMEEFEKRLQGFGKEGEVVESISSEFTREREREKKEMLKEAHSGGKGEGGKKERLEEILEIEVREEKLEKIVPYYEEIFEEIELEEVIPANQENFHEARKGKFEQYSNLEVGNSLDVVEKKDLTEEKDIKEIVEKMGGERKFADRYFGLELNEKVVRSKFQDKVFPVETMGRDDEIKKSEKKVLDEVEVEDKEMMEEEEVKKEVESGSCINEEKKGGSEGKEYQKIESEVNLKLVKEVVAGKESRLELDEKVEKVAITGSELLIKEQVNAVKLVKEKEIPERFGRLRVIVDSDVEESKQAFNRNIHAESEVVKKVQNVAVKSESPPTIKEDNHRERKREDKSNYLRYLVQKSLSMKNESKEQGRSLKRINTMGSSPTVKVEILSPNGKVPIFHSNGGIIAKGETNDLEEDKVAGEDTDLQSGSNLTSIHRESKQEASSNVNLTMPELNAECLSAMFSCLDSPHEQLNVALVCKTWLEIASVRRTSLRLQRGKNMPLTAIQRALFRCPNLTHVDIPSKSLDNPISDSFLIAMGSFCSRLESLHIGRDSERSHRFGLVGLDYLFKGCPKLVELTLEGLGEEEESEEGMWQIPESLGCLQKLQKLTLGAKHSRYPSCKTILLPESLGKVQNLRELSLSFDSPPVVPPSLWALTNLEVLRLDGWQGLLFLPDCFDELISLKVLDLRCVDLIDLPKSASIISTLRELIWETATNGECLQEGVPPSLDFFTQLECLQLRNVVKLPNLFPYLPNLTHLEVSGGVSSLRDIPTSLGSLQTLKHLKLRGNFQKIPGSISQLTSLESLSLTSSVLNFLPDSLHGLQRLKELQLDGCGAFSCLPDSLWDLPSLQTLSEPCELLSEKAGKLTSLRNLSIDCDTELSLPFDGLPSNIGNLCELKSLRAICPYMNNFPRTFVSLTSLQSLQVVWSGPLPAAFGQLQSLRTLVLDSDRLGWLPDSFGKLSALNSLVLACKKLSSLPQTFGNLLNLRTLSFKSCNSLSVFPDSFCNLTELKVLDAGCWSLLRLPKNFGRLTSLQSLEISSEKLLDFPESFGNLRRLQKLELRCPKLCEMPVSSKFLPITIRQKLERAIEESQITMEIASRNYSPVYDQVKEKLISSPNCTLSMLGKAQMLHSQSLNLSRRSSAWQTETQGFTRRM